MEKAICRRQAGVELWRQGSQAWTYQFQISMRRKGNPFDNAYAESFIKILKSEEKHLWEYPATEDVRRRIPGFIEDAYNQKQLLFCAVLGGGIPYKLRNSIFL